MVNPWEYTPKFFEHGTISDKNDKIYHIYLLLSILSNEFN